MAKASREARRQAQRARTFDTSAAELADRADIAAEGLLDAVHRSLLIAGRPVVKIDLARVPQVRRDDLQGGAEWPSWCWYPSVFLAASLTRNPDEAFINAVHTGKISVYSLATLAAWQQGRIAVRFDPDLLDALIATPIAGDIPGDVLRRLPAWALYIACPHLGAGAGVFVSLDAFPTRGRTDWTPPPIAPDQRVDEVLITFLRPDSDILVTVNLPLDQGRLAETLEASEPQPFWAQTAQFLGRPARPALQGVISLLLYLASADADVTDRRVPSQRRPGAPAGLGRGNDVDIMTAGYRVGAALRQARRVDPHPHGEPTGRHTAAHLRRAHWHSYWVGPLDQPDLRHLELRWISPVLVNAARDEQFLTVVRSVPKPSAEG